MRYTITINQLALSEIGSKISLEEAVLLDYLYWLCSSPSEDVSQMRIEKNEKNYTWFDYGFYIKETPILKGKTKATITPRIKKLEEEGFIETIHAKNFRIYVRLLPKIDSVFRKLNASVKKTKRPAFRKLNIDNSTKIDNITIDNNTLCIKKIFDFYCKKAGVKEKLSEEKKIKTKTRLKEFKPKDLKLAIDNAYKDDFYSGNNDRGWKASYFWIMKNYEHVERLINLVPKKGGQYGGYQNPNKAKTGKYAYIED